jgi:hypothetical protein
VRHGPGVFLQASAGTVCASILSRRKKNPSTISRSRSLASSAERRLGLGWGGIGGACRAAETRPYPTTSERIGPMPVAPLISPATVPVAVSVALGRQLDRMSRRRGLHRTPCGAREFGLSHRNDRIISATN